MNLKEFNSLIDLYFYQSKKNNPQDDLTSNTKVSFSRKKTNNISSDKKKSSNKKYKNSSKGNSQNFNSPRKRRK